MPGRLENVLVTDPIDPICISILKESGIRVVYKPKLPLKDILSEIQNYDALIVRSATKVTKEVLEAGKKLKIVGRAGTGVDNIDCDAATRQGIVVMNAPRGSTATVAAHTCRMLLIIAGQSHQACQSLKQGKWDKSSFAIEDLVGKTLAVIGLGRIGREVSTRMQSFGMKVIGYDPIIPAHVATEFGVEFLELEEIWPRADFITVHTPLMPETKNLINEQVFAKCRKGVRILNVARGGIVDEDALADALNSGQCGAAGLDVFVHEPLKDFSLVKHPNVFCTPHLGASSPEAQFQVAQEMAQQFVDFSNGDNLVGVLNAPTLTQAQVPHNRPWVKLAQALGNLAVSLLPTVEKIDAVITVYGSKLGNMQELLRTSVLVGALHKGPSNGINIINAPLLAKEKGINVLVNAEPKAPDGSNWTNGLAIELKSGSDRHLLSGTVNLEMEIPLLCSMDGAEFPRGLPMDGHLLFFKKGIPLEEVHSSVHIEESYRSTPEKWLAIRVAVEGSVPSVTPSVDVHFIAVDDF